MLQIREEVAFTKGRIIVRGKLVTRGKAKRADYILYYKPNIHIAIIEAKDNNHSVGDGMQQALDYATTLNIPFVFPSNGDGFVFHDRTGSGRFIGARTHCSRCRAFKEFLLSLVQGSDSSRITNTEMNMASAPKFRIDVSIHSLLTTSDGQKPGPVTRSTLTLPRPIFPLHPEKLSNPGPTKPH